MEVKTGIGKLDWTRKGGGGGGAEIRARTVRLSAFSGKFERRWKQASSGS